MTHRKNFKKNVRNRMEKTGESYTTARRHLVRQDKPETPGPVHFPGRVPATTALRIVLANAGVPFSEPMLFGIAGCIGIGICSFDYTKERLATFFIAGRHLWHDDLAYLQTACTRLGIEPVVHETSGAKAAEKAMHEILKAHGVCVAWVDAAHLPHRALPAAWSGGGYHVVTVSGADEETALLGDLGDSPVSITLKDLAVARGRIKKFKHRLLALPGAPKPPDLDAAVRDGLSACHRGLRGEGGVKGFASWFTLDAIGAWADRMHGSTDKHSWDRVFPRGRNLWRGLTGIHDYIEHHGTGGGLCRPLFAEFLTEAAVKLREPKLSALAKRYAELGRDWSELADAALPDEVPMFREAKLLLARKGELSRTGRDAGAVRAIWARLAEMEQAVEDAFPLSEADCAALRASLQKRIRALHEAELAGHAAIGEVIG